MYGRSVLLLLSLLVAVVTSQSPACIDAQTALTANEPCLNAFTDLGNAISASTNVSETDLDVYCVPECRNLVDALLNCSGDADTAVRFNQFVCTNDNGVSCYDFITSPTFESLDNATSAVCEDNIPEGQMCSTACQTEFQNFIDVGGCCVAELFEFAEQLLVNSSLDELLSQCPVDLSRPGPCTEIGVSLTTPTPSTTLTPSISPPQSSTPTATTTPMPTASPPTLAPDGGGAKGIRILGSVMLFAVIIVAVF